MRLLHRSIVHTLHRHSLCTSSPSTSDLLANLHDSLVSGDVVDPASIEKPKHVPTREPDIDTIILFPGQGAQFVGMGKKLAECPAAMQLFEKASSILNYDLYKMCTEGPEEDLNRTVNCQPAVFVTSLAALEYLKMTRPAVVRYCVETAGFSVGEYAAMVFADMIDFDTALNIIKIRAAAMQHCSEMERSGMQTVGVKANSRLGQACQAAKEHARIQEGIATPVCSVAIDMYQGCKIVGGHTVCLQYLVDNKREYGIIPTTRLPVSGAFHTQLMRAAGRILYHEIKELPFREPRITIRCNFNGLPFPPVRNRQGLIGALANQVQKTVAWEHTLHSIYDKKLYTSGTRPRTFEVGPGEALKKAMKKFNPHIHARMQCVEV